MSHATSTSHTRAYISLMLALYWSTIVFGPPYYESCYRSPWNKFSSIKSTQILPQIYMLITHLIQLSPVHDVHSVTRHMYAGVACAHVAVGHMVAILEHTFRNPSLPCSPAYFFHQFILTFQIYIFFKIILIVLFVYTPPHDGPLASFK